MFDGDPATPEAVEARESLVDRNCPGKDHLLLLDVEARESLVDRNTCGAGNSRHFARRGSREPCGSKSYTLDFIRFTILSRLARALWIEILTFLSSVLFLVVEARESLVDRNTLPMKD